MKTLQNIQQNIITTLTAIRTWSDMVLCVGAFSDSYNNEPKHGSTWYGFNIS
jgi:hypothetical protein